MGRYSWGWTTESIADGARQRLVVDYDDGSGWKTFFSELDGPAWEGGVATLERDPEGFRLHEQALRRAQKADRQDRIPRAIARHHLGREPTDDEVAAVAALTRPRQALVIEAADVFVSLGALT